MLKLDGFFGVLFSSSLCRLTLLFCSVCVLLFHDHRHPDRVFWRHCCRVHCHNSSHDCVLGRCHDLHHGVVIHGACAFLRVSEVPGTLMLLIGEDTLQVLEGRFDQEWMNCKMCSVTPSVVLVFLSHPSTFWA